MNGGEWFFLESGRQMGPVPLEQLVTLLKTRLPQGTLVWHDGMADWLKAEEVSELAASLGTPAVPPLPPLPAPPPARRDPATATSSPRVGSPTAATRPAYRPISTAPRGPAARADDDEPHTLNPFALFARCFRFGGRFDRGQFAIAYFGGVISFYVVLMAVVILGGAGGKSDTVGPVVGVAILLLAPVMIGIAFGSMVRRLHDIGQPGWYSLLIIVPCLGLIMVIYLLAAPGTAPGAPAAGAGAGVAGIIIAVVAVFGGIALIGIVAAIAIPSLLRARVSANEAAAIGDIRSVISAQAAYQSMNGGFFEGRLECLARPGDCLSNSTADPLVDAATIASPKSGYVRELVAGPAGRDLPAGLSRTSVRSFAFVAHPITAGQTGVRSFCGDASGRVCFDPGGGEDLVDRMGDEVVCSMRCQNFQ